MTIGEKPSIRAAACEELGFGLSAGGFRIQAKSIQPPGTSLTGTGPTLVFLHEGLGSITQWRGFPMALASASGLPALVYDRVGHGKSQARTGLLPPSYLETEAWERLPEVLAACGIQSPLLVGHSDGATIALLYGARFPAGTVAVVAEAPHVYVEPAALQGIWRTLRAYETTPLRERLRAHHGDRVDALFHAWSQVWLSPEFRDWSMTGHLPALTCPVLAIQGEEDEYGTPDQSGRCLQGFPARPRRCSCPPAPTAPTSRPGTRCWRHRPVSGASRQAAGRALGA